MNWTSKYTAAQVDICSALYKALSCLVVLLTDGKAERCAAVFVKEISVCLVHEQAINDSGVTHDSSLMQWSSLSIVALVLVKIFV